MRQIDTNARGRSERFARAMVRPLVGFVLIAAALGLIQWRSPLWVTSKVTQVELYLAGIHSEFVILDGHELHYLEGGTGDPVVLVHGLGSSAQQGWAKLMPYLVRSGHHVYAVDLLGFGESEKPADHSYSIKEQAGVLEKFLDEKHLEKVALAGESMGGWISAVTALDQPQRVSELILYDSAGLWFRPSFDLSLLTPQTTEQVDTLAAISMPRTNPIPDYVKEDLIREAKRENWVVQRALTSMLAGADLLDQSFSSLKMPLLIVWGKEDAVTPLKIGETMHRVTPQSVLAVYDGCGHIAVDTCADRVAPMTVSFLGGTRPQAGRTIEVPTEGLHDSLAASSYHLLWSIRSDLFSGQARASQQLAVSHVSQR